MSKEFVIHNSDTSTCWELYDQLVFQQILETIDHVRNHPEKGSYGSFSRGRVFSFDTDDYDLRDRLFESIRKILKESGIKYHEYSTGDFKHSSMGGMKALFASTAILITVGMVIFGKSKS